ncbi:MAG: hypothetical protein ACJAVZ_004487 [Afipia broomeae]|jgi:hypothetical protein
MRGLDPRIHPDSFLTQMDCRVEPGNDSNNRLIAAP